MRFHVNQIVKCKCPKNHLGSQPIVGVVEKASISKVVESCEIYTVMFPNFIKGVYWSDENNLYEDDTDYNKYLFSEIYNFDNELVGICREVIIDPENGHKAFVCTNEKMIYCHKAKLNYGYFY